MARRASAAAAVPAGKPILPVVGQGRRSANFDALLRRVVAPASAVRQVAHNQVIKPAGAVSALGVAPTAGVERSVAAARRLGPQKPAPLPGAKFPPLPPGKSDSPAVGYVFVCDDEAQADAELLGIFGAESTELVVMQRCIQEETQLFLFNAERQLLFGRFAPTGVPGKDLEPNAFSGRFPSQVRVAPLDLLLFQVALEQPVAGGPANVAEVEALKECLRQGEPSQVAAASSDDAGEIADTSAEPLPADAVDLTDDSLEPPADSGAPDNDLCWNFVRGSCRRGAQCRYLHPGVPTCYDLEATAAAAHAHAATPASSSSSAPAAAYVFQCTKATEVECRRLRLFGAPDRQLAQMRTCIGPHTELYLLNMDSSCLTGPFGAVSAVDRSIVPGAFGGRFNAQVRVGPLGDALLHEVVLPRRPPPGPKNAEELRGIKLALLGAGRLAEVATQRVWGTVVPEESPAKRLKLAPKAACSGAGSTADAEEGSQSGRRADTTDGEEAEVFRDPMSSLCWDFVAGRCPRGERCKYKHLKGDAAGYVFLCNSGTQQDCELHGLFGSPVRELAQMKHCISSDTQLFLLNYETLLLTGAFVRSEAPERHIVKEAFGGKFSAQMRVVPMDMPLLATKLEARTPAGPRSQEELDALRSLLWQAASDEVQAAWGAA